MKSEYFVLLPNDICCFCKISQPSREKRKSYDGEFVTAKCFSINDGAILHVTNNQVQQQNMFSA